MKFCPQSHFSLVDNYSVLARDCLRPSKGNQRSGFCLPAPRLPTGDFPKKVLPAIPCVSYNKKSTSLEKYLGFFAEAQS